MTRGADAPRAPLASGRALIVRPDGRVLDARGEARQFAPSCLYVRAPETMEVERVIDGVAPPLAAHPTRPLVLCARECAYSPPARGVPQEWLGRDVRLIDYERGVELDRYPLRAPCAWLDDDHFAAASAGFLDGARERSFGERHRQIQDLFSDELADGLAVVSRARGVGALVVRCGVYERWSRLRQAVARDGVLFYAGHDEVGAVRPADASILWAVPRQETGLGHDLRALALSEDGRHLAAIAAGAFRRSDLVIFDAARGRALVGLALGEIVAESGLMSSRQTELTCLAWHRSGWAAVGTRAGLVACVTPDGGVTAYRGAKGAVESLAFTADHGALLVAGRGPGVRVFELSEGERGGAA